MKNKRAQHIKLDSYKVTDRFNLNKVKIITQQNQLKLLNLISSRKENSMKEFLRILLFSLLCTL